MSVIHASAGHNNDVFLHVTFTIDEHANEKVKENDDNVCCFLNNKGNFSFANYNKNFYPSVCGSFENFKKIMSEIKCSGTKASCEPTAVAITYGNNGMKFPPFTLKFQPYIQRTDAVILSEVKAYMESIDAELAKLFVSHANHISFFGLDLMEKDANAFTVQSTIKKIEEICSATYVELVADKSPIASFVDRLNMVDGLHKKFVANVEKDCKEFADKFAETVKVDIAKNTNLHCACDFSHFVMQWVFSVFTQNNNCLSSYPTYVFKCGEIVEVNVEKFDEHGDDGLSDEVFFAIEKLGRKIANKLMMDDAYGYPKYEMDVGNYQKLVFGENMQKTIYGFDSYQFALSKFVRFNLTPESIANAFPHPSGKGILIDADGELNEVQQHIISILDEVMKKQGK